jgi:hypothetical protein
MSQQDSAQFGGTVRELLTLVHGEDLTAYITDEGTLDAGNASDDDLTFLAMLLGRAAGILQGRRDPRSAEVYALAAGAKRLRADRDDEHAAAALAAGDPWAQNETP